MKKLLVGIPAFDGIVTEAQQSVIGMMYRAGRDLPDFDVAIHISYKKEQFRARNHLVDAAISNDFDYLFMLDDDMIVPHNLIQSLLDHDKDVIGALYFQRGGLYHPIIMRRKDHTPGVYSGEFWSQEDPRITTQRGLHQTDIIGGGCMLFKVDVFRSLMQPYFETERVVGTDISICGRLQDAGHEIWVDTSIELGHVGEKKIITSRTVPMSERAMAAINRELHEDLKEYMGMNDAMMESYMLQASAKKKRKDVWGDRDAGSWEDVSEYYQTEHDWHILNLGYWNLVKNDPYKEWGVVHGAALLDKSSRVLDFGAGLGHLSVPLAKRLGCHVHALDIDNSPTQKFVEWRANRHGLTNLHIEPLDTPVPEWEYEDKLDGAFCISVMDHLTHPYETVLWIRDQLKPGAFFVCEYALHSGEDEPQHLDRYDVTTFDQWMHEIGFTTSPEHHWLFFYQG